jgi:DNA end-binding protein Ku
MARQIWTGSLSFGLVNVPVGMVSATEQKDVAFHQLEGRTNRRIRYKRVAEGTNREVDYDDIVKGYEVADGSYVTLTKEEIEAAEFEKSHSIEISDFVDLAEIDPIYYEKTYYLDANGGAANHAYALLRDAMEETQLAGVASFVMRGKEYLAVIRPWKKVLVLETLLFADEVRDPSDVLDDLPPKRKKGTRELDAAIDLIERLTTAWDPERYHDSHRERLLDIVKKKAKGKHVEIAAPERAGADVVNLMDALQRSIDSARGAKKSQRASPGEHATRKHGSAKRSASTGRRKSNSRQSARGKGAARTPTKASTRRPRSARAAADLGSLSKLELYERAANLGLSGRSSMNRTQLERAVKKASQKAS